MRVVKVEREVKKFGIGVGPDTPRIPDGGIIRCHRGLAPSFTVTPPFWTK